MIIAIVVVISLVVVGLLVSTTDSSSNVSSSASKISQSSGLISVSEAVVGIDGNGLVTLINNSGGILTITKLGLSGVDSNYSDVSLSQGEEKTFSLSDLGSGCSCVGFEGQTKTCEVIIYAESEYGLEKQFITSVSVDCVAVTSAINQNAVVQPIVSSDKAITSFTILGVNGDINESTHLITVIVPYDTNVTALIPTIIITGASINPTSGVAQNFTNPVTYTVTAADSSTQDYNVTVAVSISDCGTINTLGTYTLVNNIGAGGDCLTIAVDNTTINGAGFTITGNINAGDDGSANAFTNLTINNIIVVGNVIASGGPDDVGGYGYSGGNINVINSVITSITTTGGYGGNPPVTMGGAGGNVTISGGSIIGTIITSGGKERYGVSGGIGGSVTVTDSTTSAITTTGGLGIWGTSVGGTGGAVTIIDSNITDVITTTGGYGENYAGPGAVAGDVNITNSNTTDIIAAGGYGYGAAGGPGGIINIWNPSTYGTLSVAGGIGSPNGPIGHIYIDGVE